MARIRSIKPEFWSDEKVATLSHGCMAFFIGLWNFCDDEGKARNSPRQLALQMPVFRSKDILTWLRTLSEVGLVQFSECSQWVLVTNWKHQKIDRPRLPEVKNQEIQWVAISDSTNDRDRSSSIRRKDRIGSGSDRIGSDDTRKTKSAAPPLASLSAIAPQKTNEFIARYCELWKGRHKSAAPIVGKDAGIAKRLSKSLSREKSDLYLTAYFEMPDAYLVKARHPLELFETRLKEIAAFAESGEFLTRRQASQFDDLAGNMMLLEKVRRGEA